MDIKEKLKAYSEVSPSGCWEWKRSRNNMGYGRVSIGRNMYLAHRVSYSVFVGEIPDGFVVRHRCDNPSCCNPDHLEVGTMRDNQQDCLRRGRRSDLGSGSPNAKLTEEQLEEILKDTRSQQKIADSYGVSQTLISLIKRGKVWQHVMQQEVSKE